MESALSGIAGSLGQWMVNPWLFLAGAAAVAAPILIHLLNKRKFKMVDWAAMDFLLEADKRNRRRVKLENLILLLLRCLAVLLIGLLLARPFRTAGMAGQLFDSVRYERIVVVDDSPSMGVRAGSSTPLASARQGLDEFISGLASNGSDDALTLYLTSQPNRPVFNALHIDQDTVAEVSAEIKELETSDLPNRLEATLLEIEKTLAGRDSDINRVVYVLGDLRRRDWSGEGAAAKQSAGAKATASGKPAIVETLNRLAEQTAGCFLVDMGSEDSNNLIVTEVVPRDKALIAGVATHFDVKVKNAGPRDVRDVKVKFSAGESVPIQREIETLAAGQSASVPFTFTFSLAADGEEQKSIEPVPIRIEVVAAEPAEDDRLDSDNVRSYAARVTAGIPTLIVDGDPSAVHGKSESFYLQRALAPRGDERSGIQAQIATDVEFETLKLDDYQVIFITNVYRLSEGRRAALDAWVRRGGGLVFFLGDQVDAEVYNQELYQNGKGLLPLRLEGIEGDEKGEAWVLLNLEAKNHPVLKIFEGENNPFLEGAKVFRYWNGTIPEAELRAGRAAVLARYNNPDRTPAVIEKSLDQGRIAVLTTTADVEWNNWAQDQSYLVCMQELTRYMARRSAGDGSLSVGEPIRQPIDLTRYKLNDVSLTAPQRARTVLQPAPMPRKAKEESPPEPKPMADKTGADAVPAKPADTDTKPTTVTEVKPTTTEDESIWQVTYEETDRRGFYQLELVKTDGEKDHVLFAANLDPTEGELARVDERELASELGENVRIIDNQALLDLGTDGAKGEFWLYALAALIIVLVVEQVLGWWFGKKR